MNRAILAASLLALGTGAAAPSLAYPGDDRFDAPSLHETPYSSGHGQYPEGYGEYPPHAPYPPDYGRYGGPPGYDDGYGSRRGIYRAPRGARPPAPGYNLPQANSPLDSAGSIEAARRLYAVADTVALGGAPLCGTRVRNQIGMRTWSRDSMGNQAPQGASREGPDDAVTVFTLARSGPAARAGLRIGDKITSVNGESIPAIAGGMSIYRAKLESALAQANPISIGYTREGERAMARVVPAKGCDYRVVFSSSPAINALTDGSSVTVMRGLVTLLARDDELALVVGHEIGHSVLGHFARGRALGHQAGPFNPAAQSSMRQFEKEADYIGLYFVALSGYDMDAAIQSSSRMAAVSPRGDRGSGTHPSQAERYAVLQAALREIRAKLARGQPLRPEAGAAAVMGARRHGGEADSRLPIQ